MTFFYLASGFLLLRRARRIFPPRWGEPIAWIAITLVPVLEFGHYVMSEIPFLFFSLLALEGFEAIPDGRARAAGTTAVAAAATFYTRSVGLSLWAALFLALLFQRGTARRVRVLFGCLSASLILPWALRSILGPANPYFRQLVQVNPFYPEYGLLDAAGWATRIGTNLHVYLGGEIPMTLLPVLFRWSYDPPEARYQFLPWFIAWLPLLLLAIGLARALHRREATGFYVVFYLILNLLWPRLWTGLRFLVPLFPLLALLLFEGLFHLLGLVGRRFPARSRLAVLVVAVWVLLGIKNQGVLAREVGRYPPDWDHYFRAAAWIRDHAPPDALVVDRKAAMLAYVSGRSVVSFPREEDPERLIAWMEEQGVDLVVVPSLPYDDILRYLIPAVEAKQERFAPAFEVEDPYTVVLWFRRSPPR